MPTPSQRLPEPIVNRAETHFWTTSSGSMRGRLLILTAALLWSTSGAFTKSPPLLMLPSAHRGVIIAFYRTLFAALVLFPLVRPAMVRWRPALVVLVVCFATMNVLFVSSMTHTTAANAIVLQYTAPLWMFVGSVWLLGEPLQRGNLFSLAAGMIGVAVIVAGTWQSPQMSGVVMALGAGVAYAGVALTLRVLREEASVWLMSLSHAGSAIVLLPWMLRLEMPLWGWGAAGDPASARSGMALAVLVLFGVTQMAVPYVLFSRGLRSVSPQEAGVITLLEPLMNPLWVFMLWGECVAPVTLVGGACIFAGLVWGLLLKKQSANS